jgi:crotonobetainyl-CoA:carnitine CoA-transferase CaiB-like acyl-CoA transferase
LLQESNPLAPLGRLHSLTLNSQVNRNKKSVGLSFQQPDGVKILHELAKTSDVLVENYIPGEYRYKLMPAAALSPGC